MLLATKTILPVAVSLEVRCEEVESGKWVAEVGMSYMMGLISILETWKALRGYRLC